MKPFIEKPPLTSNISFLARIYRTPEFEIGWHQHIEHELILFNEGEGLIFMGNYVGEFKPGDIFFINSNLPHTFQKADKDAIVDACVVQFRDDFWGEHFLQLPECKSIVKFLSSIHGGIKLNEMLANKLTPLLQQLLHATHAERIIYLLQCLDVLTAIQKPVPLSTQAGVDFKQKNKERIDKIFQYTIDNFQEQITLDDIAGYAGMSVPAFCNYFKKCAKKSYVNFLNEVRIEYACTQIIDTQKSIESICYESGFNTMVNFNKQFRKVKSMNPTTFRKAFLI